MRTIIYLDECTLIGHLGIRKTFLVQSAQPNLWNNAWHTVGARPLSCVWLFVAPWTVAHQAPLPMEFSRHEYWCGVPFPSPGDLLNPGIKPTSLTSSAWAGGVFTTNATWEALVGTVQFSSVQPLNRVRLFATPWIAAHQTSLSIITNYWTLNNQRVREITAMSS